MGICPTPLKNQAVSRPLIPRPVKYSIFAGKVIRRGHITGRKNESENDRWLLAKIAGPVAGKFSSPSTHGRKISLRIGPMTIFLRNQYNTDGTFRT